MLHRFFTSLILCALPAFLSAQVATLLDATTEYECMSAKSAVCRNSKTIQIHSFQGQDQALFVCPCSKSVELKNFVGKVTDAQGKVIKKLKMADLTKSSYSTNLATDAYFYYFEYSPVSYPVTITYDWEVSYSNQLVSYPAFFPQPRYDMEVKKATYRFIATNDNTLQYKALNFEPTVVTYEKKGKTITEVQLADLPAVKKLSFSRPLIECVPVMYFSPLSFEWDGYACDLSNWQQFGLWINKLNEGRDMLPYALTKKLQDLVVRCKTPQEKVRVVREYLANNTRYVSIQLGIDGYRPMAAGEVSRLGVGDCKGLSNLFIAMLKAVGVPAVYALVDTRNPRLFRDQATLTQLNHAFVQVPIKGDTLWVECTDPSCPFDFVPPHLAGHDVLLCRPEGGVITTVPQYPDSFNIRSCTYSIQLAADGSANFNFYRIASYNCFSSDAHFLKETDLERRRSLLNSISYPNVNFTKVVVNAEGCQLTLEANGNSKSLGRMNGKRIFIPLTPNPYPVLGNPNEEPHDIYLEGTDFIQSDAISIQLPANARVESLPHSTVIKNSIGSFTLTTETFGGEIMITCTMKLNRGHYDASKYSDWVYFRQAVADLCKKQIVIVTK